MAKVVLVIAAFLLMTQYVSTEGEILNQQNYDVLNRVDQRLANLEQNFQRFYPRLMQEVTLLKECQAQCKDDLNNKIKTVVELSRTAQEQLKDFITHLLYRLSQWIKDLLMNSKKPFMVSHEPSIIPTTHREFPEYSVPQVVPGVYGIY